MGKDKALLPLSERGCFLRRIFLEAGKIYPEVWVSSARDRSYSEYPCIEDEIPDSGPLGGVVSGLAFLVGRGFDAAQVLACDLPFITAGVIARALAAFERSPASLLVAWQSLKTGKLETLSGIYSSEALPFLKSSLYKGLLSIRRILPEDRIFRLEYGEEMEKYFYNCNTWAEYERLLNQAGQREEDRRNR